MWKRLIHAEWMEVMPYIAFFLTFGVFLILFVRTILMHKSQVKRLAHLPLEEQPTDQPELHANPIDDDD